MEGLALLDQANRSDQLRTARLVLRRARLDDLSSVHAMLSDPRAMRYWSSLPHEREAQTADWLSSMIAADPETSDDFVIECDGEVIGKLGVYAMPAIGFMLHPDHWGKGYAREALAAFLPYIAGRGARHLVADVDPRNRASRALLEACGFQLAGSAAQTWLIGGEWMDSVYYEWTPQTAASA